MKLLLFLVFLFSNQYLQSQLPYSLSDGRENNLCRSCKTVIDDMPKEVLFGLQINANGDVFFSMKDRAWFDKIIKVDAYGITVDIVAKDRYNCTKQTTAEGIPKGKILRPVYRKQLLNTLEELDKNSIFVKLGSVPENLRNKELEANLIIVNGNLICHYTNFVNIAQDAWDLLPMGLFTDSLIHTDIATTNKERDFFSYTKQIQLEIPFSKGSAAIQDSYFKKLYDSIQLYNYNIKKVEIRAYASVDGPEVENKKLMQNRATGIVNALKKYDPKLHKIKVITAENWLDFYRDVLTTPQEQLAEKSKLEVKQKLRDKAVLQEVETILAKERKGIVYLFLDAKTNITNMNSNNIIDELNKAILEKQISKARILQKELVDRIQDNKLPLDYINKIEVPQTKEYSLLINDQIIYKLLLKSSSEYEALESFMSLQKIDATNGRINYNIAALQFFVWRNDADTSMAKSIFKAIRTLPSQGIDPSLVKRMRINYYILQSDEEMQKGNYVAKDSTLEKIKTIYTDLKLDDKDRYSLAKYFAYYQQKDWAKEMVTPRIDKLDVSEDLLFFYINLLFYNSENYDTEDFDRATLNAININTKRFCNFFLPIDKGGASMQLLEYESIKSKYCAACK
jgi:hypothetical protein